MDWENSWIYGTFERNVFKYVMKTLSKIKYSLWYTYIFHFISYIHILYIHKYIKTEM